MDSEHTAGTEAKSGSIEKAASDVKDGESSPREVSAATVGRMMGLATVADLRLMDGKLDLLASKLTTLSVRMEKTLAILSRAPTGADLERIDVQVGALRTLIKESLTGMAGESAGDNVKPQEKSKTAGVKIVSNAPTESSSAS